MRRFLRFLCSLLFKPPLGERQKRGVPESQGDPENNPTGTRGSPMAYPWITHGLPTGGPWDTRVTTHKEPIEKIEKIEEMEEMREDPESSEPEEPASEPAANRTLFFECGGVMRAWTLSKVMRRERQEVF